MASARSSFAVPPTVLWASDPALPGEIVLVHGEGWGDRATVELTALANDPAGKPGGASISIAPLDTRGQHGTEGRLKAELQTAPLETRGQSLKFLLPKTLSLGLYACHVVAGEKRSETFRVNAPDAWWPQGDWGAEASPGGWIGVFGKCLSFGDGAAVALRGPSAEVGLTVTRQEGWSVRAAVPKDLAPGEYRVWVHNGLGGPAGWREVGPIQVRPHEPPWKPDRFSVLDFGAIPNDAGDDTASVRAALAAAERNGGGIVLFPRGRFRLTDMLDVPRRALLQGEGRELTTLFWDDRNNPPPALIRGANSFGVQDLTLNSGFFQNGIQADDGDQPEAGHVFIRRVRMRLVKFPYVGPPHSDDEEFVRRWKVSGWGITVGGDNVQVTECDVQANAGPIQMLGCRHSRIAQNNFEAFKDGWSSIGGCERLLFEDNTFRGGTCGIAPGRLNAHYIYYARNVFDQTYSHDREGMTFDGGGHTYIGKIAQAEGARLVTAQPVTWRWGSWVGGYVYLMHGAGAGQVRRIVRHDGNEVQLDQPWAIPPDANTEVHIAKFKGRCLFVGNEFRDCTIAIQLYGCSVDVILAGNVSRRSGGFNSYGMFKGTGPEPSWHVQYFDNQIVEGSGLRGPMNNYPPTDSYLSVLSRDRRNPYPLTRWTVVRRNRLHNNARLSLGPGNMEDVLVEGNVVENADVGLEVHAEIPGALARGNRFSQVRQTLAGKTASLWMHPAERLLTHLASTEVATAERHAPAAWKAGRERLAQLAENPPDDDALRATALTLAKAVSSATKEPVPGALLRALLGLELTTQPGRDLTEAVERGTGGPATVLAHGNAASWSPTFKLTIASNAEPSKPVDVKPGKALSPRVPCAVPAGTWSAADIPLTLTAEGDGWRLAAKENVHHPWVARAIDQWMVAGPFPNRTGKLIDDAVHGPEKRLDLAAEYDGLGGKARWRPVVLTDAARTMNLAERFGADRPSVAYAVAALRTKRAVTVNFRWQNYLETMVWLNGRQIGTQWRLGNTPSVTLPAGDNVLLVMSGHQTKDWTLNLTVEPVGPLAPGDLLIVPAAELADIAALKPPPAAVSAAELPFAEGVQWQLAFEDDFNRQRKGIDWQETEGQWELRDGGIVAATLWQFLSPKLTLAAPVRIEFDVRGAEPKPSALCGVSFTPADRVGHRRLWGEMAGAGYFLTLGWHDRKASVVMREDKIVLSNDKSPVLEPGKTQRVIAQFIPPRAMLIVDGQVILDCRDDRWLPGLDTLSIFSWTREQFDNVRVYTAKR